MNGRDLPLVKRLETLAAQVDGTDTTAAIVKKLKQVVEQIASSTATTDTKEDVEDKDPAKLKLWPAPWGNTAIVAAKQVQSYYAAYEAPVVVVAQSTAEYEDAERARRAIGHRQNVLTVAIDAKGDQDVLMEGDKDQVKVKAKLISVSKTAPKKATLPKGMTNDAPIEPWMTHNEVAGVISTTEKHAEKMLKYKPSRVRGAGCCKIHKLAVSLLLDGLLKVEIKRSMCITGVCLLCEAMVAWSAARKAIQALELLDVRSCLLRCRARCGAISSTVHRSG
ncbi:unnamed protein product [Prorocentrum cordatum]|uniref:Uncharacterized protein n=1 Tax=Prorocentrum cordatum TaxID=2364126 RepID=A0ABN9XHP4_9DINO|nr:unnamed protein product [Polarella glacialis]